MSAHQESRVGLVGCGFVGGSLARLFQKTIGFNVVVFDANPERSDLPDIDTLVKMVGPEGVVFVAVNTPMCRNGSCDTSNVESIVRDISVAAQRARTSMVVCIKSTCVPGTTDRLNQLNAVEVVFSPEFLTEQNAMADLLASTRIVVGGRSNAAVDRVAAFYGSALPNAKILKTTATAAEFVKYVTNAYLAVKVALANEFADLAEAIGVDYFHAMELATNDRRLGTTHWSVPGPDGSKGFGGHCLPKDLNGIIWQTDELGRLNNVLRGAWITNLAARTDRDWERMYGRAVRGRAPSDTSIVPR